MTDFNQLDPFRKKADPLQLDLVESFAKGKINRRHFIQRGTVLGLSLASISAIVAACGGSSSDGGGASVETAEGAISEATTAAAVAGGKMIWGMSKLGSEGINPVTMIDLVTYNVTAQVFEYLVRSAADLSVQPQLASEWTANPDGTEWTFKLREGVMWADGTPMTSADVVATFDRLIEAGNSALSGTLEKGGTTAPDDTTVVFTLASPNGNFPYLVSSDNTQSQIVQAAWTVEKNLEAGMGGTGPWIVDTLDPATGVTYKRNEAWWGGTTPLDEIEFKFIEDPQAQIAAMAAGEVDGLPAFSYDIGEVLFQDSNINIVEMKSATHRQISMRTDKGALADKRLRQAIALTFDREKMVEKLLGGRGAVANDNVIFGLYPYSDTSVPQRAKDIEKAKALLVEAGAEGLEIECQYIKGLEMPGLAQIMQEGAKEAGINIKIVGVDYSVYYSKYWCPAEPAEPPCSGASDFNICDYGHRGTPDVYLNAALKTGGVWNSAQYQNAEFDGLFKEFQGAIDVDAKMGVCKKIQENLIEETPYGIGYTISALACNSNKFQGVANTAMGFTFLEAASQA
ncbi:MAG: ABC transporter substrate-binding protein [Thermoleophilia bacterium]|jgi:peptide/nickel transport system substrate-binding protein|nr:ABC transporter substrate-binding protein [Thermoleophilia bacterium]